jgi:iron complex transport system substrate-binding protein
MNAVRSLAIACALAACSMDILPASAAVSVTDDDGATIALAAPARRIISLAPHVTELLFAAGAGDRIVGTVRYSDHPPAASAIPRIGDSFNVDSERIVGLKPELMIVWLHGNPEAQLERLRRLGIPVFASEPRRLADIASTIRRFGQLAGTDAVAAQSARAFGEAIDALRTRYASRPAVRVFYQVAERPLLTVNGRHLIDDVIRLCGGVNDFAELRPLTPEVSAEAVLAADPEAIVTAGGEAGNATGFALWSRLTTMTAARRGNFILLHSDTISRQSDRILDGARELCAKLEEARARRRS